MPPRMLPKNSLATVVVVSFCLLTSVACQKNEPAPTAVSPTTPVVRKPVQKQLTSPVQSPPISASQFDFSNKKDPFKPFVVAKNDAKKTPSVVVKSSPRNALPIHSYEINQFKMIGLLLGGRDNRAMVTDPGGKGYVLKVGMSIGVNDGKIMAIDAQGVEVVEMFKDDNGRVRKEKTRLTLPRKQ